MWVFTHRTEALYPTHIAPWLIIPLVLDVFFAAINGRRAHFDGLLQFRFEMFDESFLLFQEVPARVDKFYRSSKDYFKRLANQPELWRIFEAFLELDNRSLC